MTHHYVNSHNIIISFEDIIFWPKIYLIFHPSLENSKTCTNIVHNEKQNLIQHAKVIKNWNFIINPCIPFIIWNLFSYWYSSQQKSWKIAACHEYHRPASLVYCWWWHFLWPMFSHSWAQLSLVGKKYLT